MTETRGILNYYFLINLLKLSLLTPNTRKYFDWIIDKLSVVTSENKEGLRDNSVKMLLLEALQHVNFVLKLMNIYKRFHLKKVYIFSHFRILRMKSSTAL